MDTHNPDISLPLNYTTPERLLLDFAIRGLVVLSPESLGIPAEVHTQVYKQEKAVHDTGVRVTPANVPAVLDLLNAPGLVAACNQLVGKNWAIVPFTHNASFTSGARDQHWHKDDNGPYNSRKQRHHQAVQIEMLYYPQAVTPEMGPTATVPYSQYWTFNHEENHDNFAGADHLDFAYVLAGMEREPVSGPDSKYALDDIIHARTAHDIRMREAVTKTGWPLVYSFAAAPLRAGSVVLYSHNTFHRGNHRRDDWRTWQDNPRFMWRFWLYRTTDPDATDEELATDPAVTKISWHNLGVDPMTNLDLSQVSDDVTTVWRYHYHWLKSGQTPPPRPEAVDLAPDALAQEAEQLFAQMHAKEEAAEPLRIGAAYKLASLGDPAVAIPLLEKALYTDRESVRRAATYGLIAVGAAATDTFLRAANSPIKWVRKAGVYGLGDASPLTETVLRTVVARLQEDSSVYIRSVAAGTLGCLGRRASATGIGRDLIPHCLAALVKSLAGEENRLAMSKAQGRSIKFVRPTDECDVCEGDGVDFGLARYAPVRSAVRENVLWSIVILCSHGPEHLGTALESTVTALQEVIRADKNVIAVGFAMDALARLANLQATADEPQLTALQTDLRAILGESPMQCWESLVRAAVTP
ncbi:MAG: HEAT repeat domain-containing protein [Caldilineaceae bacterium]|nr:HEAT repeat domain-containing protein [Caldilineaceae bacterium]